VEKYLEVVNRFNGEQGIIEKNLPEQKINVSLGYRSAQCTNLDIIRRVKCQDNLQYRFNGNNCKKPRL
jgi:hypothetical protein